MAQLNLLRWMATPLEHQWTEEQRAIAAAVSEVDEAKCLSRGDAPSAPYGQLKLVAGVDISFRSSADSSFGEDCTDAVAVLVVCEFPSMQVVRTLSRTVSLQQPYIPGFLAFREGEPLLLLAQEALSLPEHEQPQLLFVDGNGLLHERRCGLATYIGVKSGLPTVGVAKDYHPFSSTPPEAHLASQRAMREHCRTALQKRGDSLTLFDPPLGAAVITSPAQRSSKPVFVSVGNRISLQTAIDLTLACSTSARVPEPIRQADLIGRGSARETWQ